ncbi:MAG: HAL/PAL/TAL family ammonia-lyase [Myxococcales bacterium]
MSRETTPIEIGLAPLTIEQVVRLAKGAARVALSTDGAWHRRIEAGPAQLAHRLDREPLYGITTGFGDSCETAIPPALAARMQLNLVRFHGCGTGQLFTAEESAAILTARLASLRLGWSAVRELLLERLCDLLNHRILPCIPAEGSVGASGDLTPLSYVAALLIGEREALAEGKVVPAAEALAAAGLSPIELQPKEALALMNGTSAMTALACLAFARAQRLVRFCASLSAMASDVTGGNPHHFDDRLFAAKPHPGQRAVARWIAADIELASRRGERTERIQDRYSVRCAPHVIGVLVDALPFLRRTIEIELNGANDNPLIDPDNGDVLHGGNFYGGHIAFAMDAVKAQVASLADLLDRQMVLICTPSMSNGLPANLVAALGPERVTHHGFKAAQILTSALAAEALKLTMPASSFSRSTEGHNQDKVSMGTIAARDCLRVLDLTETLAAAALLALCQAADLQPQRCHARTRSLRDAVRRDIPQLLADRRMDQDIARVLERYRADGLPIGENDFS